jgi:hypothetical protein
MRIPALLIPLVLAACAQDPFERPHTWSVPQNQLGSNDANLRTMIADPRDLAAGTGEPDSRSNAATPPVRRLLTGRRAPLPQSSTVTLQTGGTGAAPAPAPPAPTAPQ